MNNPVLSSENFEIKIDYKLFITTRAIFLRFQCPLPFPDAKDGNILNVRVDSDEDVCAIVSVQKPGGPVWDDEARIRDDNLCLFETLVSYLTSVALTSLMSKLMFSICGRLNKKHLTSELLFITGFESEFPPQPNKLNEK